MNEVNNDRDRRIGNGNEEGRKDHQQRGSEETGSDSLGALRTSGVQPEEKGICDNRVSGGSAGNVRLGKIVHIEPGEMPNRKLFIDWHFNLMLACETATMREVLSKQEENLWAEWKQQDPYGFKTAADELKCPSCSSKNIKYLLVDGKNENGCFVCRDCQVKFHRYMGATCTGT